VKAMKHNLKISVSKEPKDGGIVSYRNIVNAGLFLTESPVEN
jgi:hypothetical protein